MTRVAGSLRARLLLALALIFVLGAAGMDLLRRSHARSPDEVQEETGLATEARVLAASLRFDSADRLVAVTPPADWRRVYALPGASAYTVFSPTGAPEARSPNLSAPLAKPEPSASVISPLRLIHDGGTVTLSMRGPRGRTLVIERPNPGALDGATTPTLDDYAPTLLFGVLAACAVLAAWVIAVWSLQPLERAAEELSHVAPDRPDARLSGDGLPSEFAPLAREVNAALDRVSAAYAAQARFTADAAHALRTPLSVLDLRLQRAQGGAPLDWTVVRGDLLQLRQVVSGLLALTRAERASGERVNEDVQLARLVRECAALMAPTAEAQGRGIEVEDAGFVIMVRGDLLELREMILALIDNALMHGGGRVLLQVHADDRATVGLRVSDEGSGVPNEARELVFERFHKLRGASPGAGLGLSIVRRTARNLGGEARLIAPSTVEVRLPTSPFQRVSG